MEQSISEKQQQEAANILEQLTAFAQQPTLLIKDGKQELTLPNSLLTVLKDLLSYTAAGKPTSILPIPEEVSIENAAHILNVSPPFVIELMNDKKIPYRKDGIYRRILLEDVLTYKTEMKKIQSEQLDFLAQQAQELNLGY